MPRGVKKTTPTFSLPDRLALKGLRKVSKAFGGGKAKSFLDWDQKRIVFWLDAD